MNVGLLGDDDSVDNNLELVITLTEYTKIARISVDKDGSVKFYERKTLPIIITSSENKINTQQEILPEESNDWDGYIYGNTGQIIAITIGLLSFVAFSYSLYLFYTKGISLQFAKLDELQKSLNKLKQAKEHCIFLKDKKTLKYLGKESLGEYLRLLSKENNEYLDKLTEGIISNNILVKKALKIAPEVNKKLNSIASEYEEVLGEMVFCFAVASLSTSGMLGSIYAYEYFENYIS